ncbi:FadR/GntR family transcriptional regulator [Salinifilum aidingensis]
MTSTIGEHPRRAALDPLAEQILTLIHERGLRVGDSMPTELELIEELSVSRNSVREAVRALRALGIVDIRHGHGTFVGEAPLHALSPALTFRALADRSSEDLGGLRDLVDIRELVEVGVVERLVGALPDETLDHLAALCDEMERTDLDPDVDREFHRTLHARLDNPLVGQLVDVFWDSYHAAEDALTLPAAADSARTVAQHRAIVEALRAGDSRQLRTAMLEHFADIKDRLDLGARRR